LVQKVQVQLVACVGASGSSMRVPPQWQVAITVIWNLLRSDGLNLPRPC
jgi:hypothetical protein